MTQSEIAERIARRGTNDMSLQMGFTPSNTFIWRRLNKEQVENLESRRQ